MHLGVGCSLALGTLDGVEIDRPDFANTLAERKLEYHWLVHIVPDAADAHIHEGLLHVTPPRTYLWSRVIGEDRVIGPDVAVEDRADGAVDEHIPLQPFAVDAVIGIALHAGVDDRHDAESIAAQVVDHCLRIGEALWIPGKDAIPVHVVDVQVNRVAGDVASAKLGRQLTHHRIRYVGPAALVVAKCPAWWQRHSTQQRAETLAHLFWCRPVDHVVVEFTACSLHLPDAGSCSPYIEVTAPRVIEEDAIGQSGP